MSINYVNCFIDILFLWFSNFTQQPNFFSWWQIYRGNKIFCSDGLIRWERKKNLPFIHVNNFSHFLKLKIKVHLFVYQVSQSIVPSSRANGWDFQFEYNFDISTDHICILTSFYVLHHLITKKFGVLAFRVLSIIVL